MKKIILEIKGKKYTLKENALSAARILRRAIKMIHDEDRRNIKNNAIHIRLQRAIGDLQVYEGEINEIEKGIIHF
jgi:hypothetical protein